MGQFDTFVAVQVTDEGERDYEFPECLLRNEFKVDFSYTYIVIWTYVHFRSLGNLMLVLYTCLVLINDRN